MLASCEARFKTSSFAADAVNKPERNASEPTVRGSTPLGCNGNGSRTFAGTVSWVNVELRSPYNLCIVASSSEPHTGTSPKLDRVGFCHFESNARRGPIRSTASDAGVRAGTSRHAHERRIESSRALTTRTRADSFHSLSRSTFGVEASRVIWGSMARCSLISLASY